MSFFGSISIPLGRRVGVNLSLNRRGISVGVRVKSTALRSNIRVNLSPRGRTGRSR